MSSETSSQPASLRSGWERLGSRPHLIGSGLVMVFFMAWVLPEQAASTAAHSELRPPDLSLAYSTEELRTVLDSMGEAGREAYIRSRYAFDVAWPLAYTWFYLAVLAWAVPRAWPEASRPRELWPWIGMAPFWIDMAENVFTGLAAARFPDLPDWLGLTASVLTSVKWCAVGLTTLLLLGSVAGTLLRRARWSTKLAPPTDTSSRDEVDQLP